MVLVSKPNSRAMQSDEAALSLCKCPYEHRVIDRSSLPLQVSNHLGMIEDLRTYALKKIMWDTIGGSMMLTGLNGIKAGGSVMALSSRSLRFAKNKLSTILESYPDEDRKLIQSAIIKSMIPGCEYAAVNTATKLLPKLFKRLAEQDVNPFGKGVDASSYDAAIVDNNCNLVLLQSPKNTDRAELTALAGFLRNMQWKQPFQRTRVALTSD